MKAHNEKSQMLDIVVLREYDTKKQVKELAEDAMKQLSELRNKVLQLQHSQSVYAVKELQQPQ